ncbi:cation:proton antiporter, partial [Staphylococcus nepalensis]
TGRYRTTISRQAGWIALSAPVISAIYFITMIPRIAANQLVMVSLPWMPSIDVNFAFRLDGLSLIFALLITLIGTGVVLYANAYLSKAHDDLPRFYVYLLMFMFAMLGVVLANNTILLYVFWELTSIASFLLIAYWYNRPTSQAGAMKSFLITVFGGMFMMVGFVILFNITGTNTISELVQIPVRQTMYESPWFPLAVVFILLGAFTKSAQFPFHIWLPDAMEAPT